MSKVQITRLIRLIKEGDVSGAEELYHLLERLIPDLNSSLKKSTPVLNAQEDPHTRRFSVFLLEKTKSLHQAIRFFLAGSSNVPSNERRAYFLSYVDFWEGQVKDLIRDFSSFEERSRVWDQWPSLSRQLTESGYLLREKAEQDLKWTLRLKQRYRNRFENLRKPLNELNALIVDWNQVLIVVSKILQKDQRDLFIQSYTKKPI